MREIVQSVIAIIRGGLHPREVALAVCLGMLAGFLTGWNLCLAAVLLLVLMLNVPTKVFGQAWMAGTAISWMLTPVSYWLGRTALEETSLGESLAAMREHPLVMLCDLDRYTITGGAILALLMAVPVAMLVSRATHYLQEQFRHLQAAATAQTDCQASLAVRLGCWLIFGDAAQPQLVPVRSRMMRPNGMMLMLGVLLPAAGMGWCYAPGMAERSLLAALSAANQSEVNVGHIRVSLADGKLEISDLQISDPTHPERDRLRVGYVAAQLRTGPLLRGHFHVDQLLLDTVAVDVPRPTRARPIGINLPSFDSISLPEGTLPDLSPSPSAIELQDYLSNWEQLHDRLSRVQELLDKVEHLAGAGHKLRRPFGDRPAMLPPPVTYLAMRSQRCDFGQPLPAVWFGTIGVKNLSENLGIGSQGSIEIVNFSNDPETTGLPTQVALRAPQLSTEILAQLNLHKPGMRHQLKLKAQDIALAELIQPKMSRSPLAFQGGTLHLSGTGSADAKEFELALRLELKNLNAQVSGDRQLAGLPSNIWNLGLRQLGQMRTEAVVCGSWTAPRLKFDNDQLVAQFKQQLQSAGEQMLVAAIDEQVARSEAALERAIDKPLAKAEQAVDRSVARAEQTIDHAAARSEALAVEAQARATQAQRQLQQIAAQQTAQLQNTMDRGQSQVVATQQRVEQGASQVAAEARRYQDRYQDRYAGAASKFGENVAAVQSLVNPGPAPRDMTSAAAAMMPAPAGPPPAVPQIIAPQVAAVPVTAPVEAAPEVIVTPATAPQVAVSQPNAGPVIASQVVAPQSATISSRRGPPNIDIGPASNAPAEVYNPSQQIDTLTDIEEAPQNVAATQPDAGLRYPASIQSPTMTASQFDASAAIAPSGNVAPSHMTTNPYASSAPPAEVPEANTTAAATIDRLPATTDSEPVAEEAASEARPASFDAPAAVGMEMGYDVERSIGRTAARSAPPARQPPRFVAQPPESLTDPESEVAAPAESSRATTWTAGVGNRLKGLMPWPRKTEVAAETTAEPTAPAATATPRKGNYFSNLTRGKGRTGNAATEPSRGESAPADAGTETAAAPWYKRVLR